MLEPPIFPDKPIKPDRKKIIAVGILGALVGSLALVALLESLDGRLRGVEAMSAVINMRPLVIVPYITTQAELKRKRHLTRYWILALIAALLLALLLIHLLVAPLDLLIAKIMARFV
jgi:polysaccharide biosynthesis transport protein